MKITIRPLEEKDNSTIARIIRTVLKEHGVDKPGTVFTDPTTDNLYKLFLTKKAMYWVAEVDGEIVGGCGIYPTIGLPAKCTELVKLYLLKTVRGLGLGKQLMNKCAEEAKTFGYTSLYLETMPELSNAIGLYESLEYKKLATSLGDSGHFACDVWMLKNL